MKRFDYMVGGMDVKWKPEDEQAQLNELGEQGWELVSVVVRPDHNGRLLSYFYLRREQLEKKSISAVDNPKCFG